MMESVKIAALGIVFAIICVLIKHYREEFVVPTRISALIIIFGIAILMMTPILDYLKGLMGQTVQNEYMEIVLKALAISYMTQISSELCDECGEKNIAFAVGTIGKIELIILSLPLINKIISMSEEMISW